MERDVVKEIRTELGLADHDKRETLKKNLIKAGAVAVGVGVLASGVNAASIYKRAEDGTLTDLAGASDTNEVKVSSNDTTAGYLNGKLVAGLNASLTENNNGGDETLTIKGKAEVQTGEPASPHTGAIWFDTDDAAAGVGNLTASSPLSVTGGTGAVNGTGAAISIDLTTYVNPVTTKAINYTVLTSDNVILCSSTITITLPTAVGNSGKIYEIKNTSTGRITVDGNGTELIEDTQTQELYSYESITIVSNGTKWLVI